jgi:hypothetical protein
MTRPPDAPGSTQHAAAAPETSPATDGMHAVLYEHDGNMQQEQQQR